MLAYLVMMAARLVELRRVLKPTGSTYLHCDSTAGAYLKVLLDAIFGPKNFLNEIVWKRFNFHADATRFGRVTDRILFYSRSAEFTFRPPRVPFSAEYIDDKFRYDDGDGRGRYRLDNLNPPGGRGPVYEFHGITKPWRYTEDNMRRLEAEDRIYVKSKTAQLKRYLNELDGQAVHELWSDIAPINPRSNERLGYPTQKPLALLERIIEASSNPGDLVLDPFCGCGTAVDAAQKLGRRWMGIDITYLAVDLIEKRLRHIYGEGVKDTFTVVGIPRDVEAAEALFHRSPFEFERWAVSLVEGQPNEKQVGDRGIDGIIRFHADGKGETERIIVSVKGGRQLGPQMVRDLAGTVANHRAAGGVLITLAPATRGMIEAANHAGLFRHERQGKSYPKVQLANISDLLKGKRPQLPPVILPYIQAKRREAPDRQESIF